MEIGPTTKSPGLNQKESEKLSMLKVSRKLNYGLQLMVALAFNKDNQSIATSKYAEQLEIPLPFLHQIAHALQLNGLIKATPGPKGGLRLGNKGLGPLFFLFALRLAPCGALSSCNFIAPSYASVTVRRCETLLIAPLVEGLSFIITD